MSTRAELSLSTVNAVFQTYEGRDRLARIVQFGCRAIMGLTAGSSSQVLAKVSSDARSMMVTVSGARRSFRWGRELPVLLSIPAAFQLPGLVDTSLDLFQKVTLLTFFTIDHAGWLKQIRGGAKRGLKTIQLGLKFLTVSLLTATLLASRKLLRLREAPSTSDEERRQCKLAIARNGLMAFQVAHLSRWWDTSDVLVGLLGIVTSVIDIMPVWPEKKAAPPTKKKRIADHGQNIQNHIHRFERNGSADSTSSTEASTDA